MSASPINGSTVYQRHQFRRQGSSYGPGHVHNMAVMIAPQKLDYSVTKGGLKTWAVLIVFFLLCLALLETSIRIETTKLRVSIFVLISILVLAIFSESNQFDEDDNVYTIEDADDDTEQPIESSVDPEDEETIIDEQPTPPDIDDESIDDNEEEMLFATLREKAKEATVSRKTQPKQKFKSKEEESVEEESQEQPEPRHIQRRRQRQLELERQRLAEEEAERLGENEAVDKSEEEVDDNASDEDSQEDEGDDNSDEDSQEDDDEPEPTKSPPPPKQQKPIKEAPKKEPIKEPKKEPEIDDDSNENEDEEDDDDDDQDELVLPKQLRTPRKIPSGVSWHKSIQAQHMAEDQQSPRMSLLKGKHHKIYPKLKAPLYDSSQQSKEEKEDEDSNEIDDGELVRGQTRDISTIRKRTNFYNRKAITNKQDFKHRGKLDNADFLLEKHDFDAGIRLFEEVLTEYKDSPRAHFGIARANQLKSEFQASDSLIDLAINEYQKVLDNYETPDELFRLTADHLVDCARFRGNLHKVMTVQRELVDKFPEDIELQNNFGVTFLMMGRPEDARTVFTTILEIDPQNPVAQAYFGYLLKVYDQDYERGVQFMRKGLRARDEPIQDPKFYFHLGDGLTRLGRNQDAFRVYEEAVELGLFPSVYQRSTYNLDGLSARPWWTLSQTRCARHLKSIERQWTVFREEALNAWNENTDLFLDEDAHITTGVQRALWLRTDNTFNEKNCNLVPTICSILKDFAQESNCDKGDIKISVMQPGSRVFPNCGPTNFVLEAQLGLISPSEARVRVGKEIRGWKTGKFHVFDKSFEHELWFDGASSASLRMILTIDLWHPEVPLSSRINTVY